MGTKQLTKKLMFQLVERCRRRRHDLEYYYLPHRGWLTRNDEPIPCPKIFNTEPNPYAEYHILVYESIWRLHRDTDSGQYVVSEMKVYPDINSTVYWVWVLSTDELTELLLDIIRKQDSHAQSRG